MRAGRDDALDRCLAEHLVEHLDVLHCLHLKQELVADPSRRIAGAAFAFAEHHELHAGNVQQFGERLRRLLRAILQGAGAADPVQVLHVRRDRVFAVGAEHADREVHLVDPRVTRRRVHPPGVALVLDVAQHHSRLGRERRFDQHLEATHVDDVVDMLDVDRALLHASAACRARPQDLGVDDATVRTHQEAFRFGEDVCRQVGTYGFCSLQVRRLGVSVVTQVRDEQLR